MRKLIVLAIFFCQISFAQNIVYDVMCKMSISKNQKTQKLSHLDQSVGISFDKDFVLILDLKELKIINKSVRILNESKTIIYTGFSGAKVTHSIKDKIVVYESAPELNFTISYHDCEVISK